jgi:hypothetical protein
VLDKIDIRDLLRDHYRTLVVYPSDKRSLGDYILFLGAPAAIVAVLSWQHVTLSDNAISLLINALAIFAGLLFNLLVLVHGLARSRGPTGEGDTRLLLTSVYANIAYSILLSLLTLVPLVIAANATCRSREIAAAFAIFLVSHFTLTLLMVLKRIHALVTHEMRQS